MELAHSAGTSGGPNIEFLVLGGGMLLLGVLFFFQKTVKPVVSLVLLLGAFALAAGAFAFDGGDTTGAKSIDASIRILSPQGGEEVPAGEPFPVRVEISGGTLTSQVETDDATAGHLHLYVDDELVSMPSNDAPEVELPPGEHTIAVEFTAADHHSYEPRIIDEVEVTAS